VFAQSCKLDSKKLDGEEAVQQAIQQDLETGIGTLSRLNIDQADLPKKKYIADKDHSSISFRTKHWEIVDLIGWFSDFDIIMHADKEDFSDAVIFGKVYPKSITMPNIKMQGSVPKPPYIDTESFPEASFVSNSLNKISDVDYKLKGKFSLNGIEKELSFDVRFNGFAYPREKSICGFTINGELNRHDFNIAGDDRLHSGKALHDDIIYLTLSLRME
jgi:polyisoprenoid-binding protein YceI